MGTAHVAPVCGIADLLAIEIGASISIDILT